MTYLILSLKWSNHHRFLVWWGPDDSGYYMSLDAAGRYTEEQIRSNESYYNNGDSTLAVPLATAEKLSIKAVPADSANVLALRDEAMTPLEVCT